ncbi:MAG: hypothetical protein V3U49_06390 [Nitrososphaerales archaeon]|jgi:hypothetical protein
MASISIVAILLSITDTQTLLETDWSLLSIAASTILVIFPLPLVYMFAYHESVARRYPKQSLPILLDEMHDGVDERLIELGYNAYSVRKLRNEGNKMKSDYSVIRYAALNGMTLVSEDSETIEACAENGISHIKFGQNQVFSELIRLLTGDNGG